MTNTNFSPEEYIASKIRLAYELGTLTDYNAVNRTGTNFVFPDKPRIKAIMNNKNNFPRISIDDVIIAKNEEMGFDLNDIEERISLNITVWTVKDLVCKIEETVNEEIIYLTGTSDYTLANEYIGGKITEITGTMGGNPHTFTSSDYSLIDSDNNLRADTIRWSGGDTPDNGTNFYITYGRYAEGGKLAEIIGKELHTYLRNNWRDNFDIYDYEDSSSQYIDFDKEIGIFRYEISIIFLGIGASEGFE